MKRWLFLVAPLLTVSCALGPNYQRPAVAMPAQFRQPAVETPQDAAASLADVKWFDLFNDDTLTRTVNAALAQNLDLQIAAERVLQARARARIAHSDQLPGAAAGVAVGQNRFSQVGVRPLPAGADPDVSSFQAGFSLGWELDVWGRLRRLNESARPISRDGRGAARRRHHADRGRHQFLLRAADARSSARHLAAHA